MSPRATPSLQLLRPYSLQTPALVQHLVEGLQDVAHGPTEQRGQLPGDAKGVRVLFEGLVQEGVGLVREVARGAQASHGIALAQITVHADLRVGHPVGRHRRLHGADEPGPVPIVDELLAAELEQNGAVQTCHPAQPGEHLVLHASERLGGRQALGGEEATEAHLVHRQMLLSLARPPLTVVTANDDGNLDDIFRVAVFVELLADLRELHGPVRLEAAHHGQLPVVKLDVVAVPSPDRVLVAIELVVAYAGDHGVACCELRVLRPRESAPLCIRMRDREVIFTRPCKLRAVGENQTRVPSLRALTSSDHRLCA